MDHIITEAELMEVVLLIENQQPQQPEQLSYKNKLEQELAQTGKEFLVNAIELIWTENHRAKRGCAQVKKNNIRQLENKLSETIVKGGLQLLAHWLCENKKPTLRKR